MADLKISDLPAAGSATGAMQFEVNDGGTSRRVTGSQVQDLAIGTTNGILARTGANTVSARTLAAGVGVSVSNGDGVVGNPTVAIDDTVIYDKTDVDQLLLDKASTSSVSAKLDKTGGTITGRLNLELGDLGTNVGTANFANRNVWKVAQAAAMTLTVSNLADGNDGQVNLTWTAGALSFSGVTRWAVDNTTVSAAFTDTDVGKAGLVSGALYQFVFSNIGGTITGRVGRV
jgi:hypothetical protein